MKIAEKNHVTIVTRPRCQWVRHETGPMSMGCIVAPALYATGFIELWDTQEVDGQGRNSVGHFHHGQTGVILQYHVSPPKDDGEAPSESYKVMTSTGIIGWTGPGALLRYTG